MWEKINGKCCFRSKEKVLEVSDGLRWGSIQTAVWHGVRLSGTIHRVSVILGNWGTGGQLRAVELLPAAVQWDVMFASRNPQVLGVPWLFETMALLGCRFVGSRRSRGYKQSCWISPRRPFLLSFSSHSLSTVELSPCCSLGLEFLGCAEAARFSKHGSTISPPSPVWEFGSSFNCLAWGKGSRSRSLKADSPLWSRMRKERHAWHFSWVFPGRKAELSSHCELRARLSKNCLFCTSWTSYWESLMLQSLAHHPICILFFSHSCHCC